MNILILTTNINGGATKDLKKKAEEKGHTVRLAEPKDLYCYVSDLNGNDTLYDKDERITALSFDVVIPRLSGNGTDTGITCLRHIAENMSKPSTNNVGGIMIARDKFWTCQVLSKAKIKLPKTIFAGSPQNPQFLIDKVGGLPCVVKTIQGSQGYGVSILETKLSANTTLQTMYSNDLHIHLQQFLEANNKDIRAFVVDGVVVAAMERTANKGDFRANLSQGGSGKKIDLTPEENQTAIDSAQALGLGVAGVDIMRLTNGTFKVIEVNSNPGFGIAEVTGVNVALKIIEYAESLVNGKPKEKELNANYHFTGNFVETKYIDNRPVTLYECTNGSKKLFFNKQYGFYFEVRNNTLVYTENV